MKENVYVHPDRENLFSQDLKLLIKLSLHFNHPATYILLQKWMHILKFHIMRSVEVKVIIMNKMLKLQAAQLLSLLDLFVFREWACPC